MGNALGSWVSGPPGLRVLKSECLSVLRYEGLTVLGSSGLSGYSGIKVFRY